MDYVVKIFEEADSYGSVHHQGVINKDTNEVLYAISNMSECPEDAVIGRGLFTADEYVDAIRFGMNLASQGYTDIIVERDKQYVM